MVGNFFDKSPDFGVSASIAQMLSLSDILSKEAGFRQWIFFKIMVH